MELGKIFSAVLLPLIVAIVLGLVNVFAVSYLLTATTMIVGGIIAIVTFLIGLAILLWAGYKAAKAVSGGAVVGAVGAVIVSIISGIINGIASFILVPMLPAVWVLNLVITLIIGAIIAAVIGAIGGFFGRPK